MTFRQRNQVSFRQKRKPGQAAGGEKKRADGALYAKLREKDGSVYFLFKLDNGDAYFVNLNAEKLAAAFEAQSKEELFEIGAVGFANKAEAKPANGTARPRTGPVKTQQDFESDSEF